MNKKFIKKGLILIVSGLLIGGGVVFYMINKPHRDVQAADIDFEITSDQLVTEYLSDRQAANTKYLQEEGESKILAIEGVIASMDVDMKKQKVLLLKSADAKAGVSCTFTESTNSHADNLKTGDKVTIKGIIRSGAGYDEDLEMYEDVIVEKCDMLN